MQSSIELSQAALEHNLTLLRGLVGECCLIAPSIKANAYGHGLTEVAGLMAPHVNGFSVFSVNEAVRLQESGIELPILIMGPVEGSEVPEIVRRELRVFVDELPLARLLAEEGVRQGKAARGHLKVDTGMSRFGVPADEVEAFLGNLGNPEGLRIEGVATQTANADEPGENPATWRQYERFQAAVAVAERLGYAPSIRHMANSGIVLRYPAMHLDMVRPGISCYGYLSVPAEDNLIAKGGTPLRPIIGLYSTVTHLKTVPSGAPVSYGGRFVTERETRLAVFPLGYSDGIPPALSNRGYVLIRGRKAPIRGRVCMNATIVDVTEIPDIKVGDRITILGVDASESVTATDWAHQVQMDEYALLTGLAPHLPRLVV